MTYRIEFEVMCGCCNHKSHQSLSFDTFEEMNDERMLLLQAMEETDEIYFATLQCFVGKDIISCYYVSGADVRIVDASGDWDCHKLEEVA